MGKAASTSLKEGMKNMSPKDTDASTKIRGGSVNSGTTRSSPAKQPPVLGPRTA